MPRIDPIDPATAEGQTRTLLDGIGKKYGRIPNLLATLAQAPAALDAYLGLGRALGGGSLDAGLREQIAVAVAGANSCGYCASAHTAIGTSVGVDAGELEANLRGEAADPRTQAALDFALVIVEKRGWASDNDLQRVRDAGFGDGEITEIVVNVVANIFSNYFNHVAQTEIDFPVVKVGEPSAA